MEDERVTILQSLSQHPGWALVRSEIDKRITMNSDALRHDSSTASLEEVRKLQGRIAELTVLRDWPEQTAKQYQLWIRK